MNPQRDRMLESNPFVDVATHLFLEDIADKQGAAGLNNYLMSLATNLAKSMPKEEYLSWDEFLDAVRFGNSIITAFEEVFTPTPNCLVTRRSPFERGWVEYIKRVGSFSRIHREVADYYNSTVKPTTLNSLHIIHQTFRAAASARIRVGGREIRYAQIATVWTDGEKKIAPEEWLPVLLERGGITHTQLNMLLRNNADVWLLYQE